VDPINRLDKATPLHLAVITEDPDDRALLVESLLEAGADYGFVRPHPPFLDLHRDYNLRFGYRIRDKHGRTARDLVKSDDEKTLALFRKAQAEASISRDDIARASCPPCPQSLLLHYHR